MPQIETWSRLPAAVRAHLVERMHDRKISLEDLNQLRLWIEAKPQAPPNYFLPEVNPTKAEPASAIVETPALAREGGF
jgi:hypothetical protein